MVLWYYHILLFIFFLELYKSAESIEENKKLWRAILEQRVVLACFKEGSDEIIGLNFLYVIKENEKGLTHPGKSYPWTQVYGTLYHILNQIDLFNHYKVDKCMTAFGLSILPKYRGHGIAFQMLKARYLLSNI